MKEAIMAAEFLGIVLLIVLWLRAKAETVMFQKLAEKKHFAQEAERLKIERMIARINSVLRTSEQNVPPNQATRL